MPATAEPAETAAPPRPLRLRFAPAVEMTDEQFYQFCRQNRDLRLERTSEGEIIVIAPAGSASSHRNADLTTQLMNWSKKDGIGVVFDSSGGFKLPNGADRAPDASWVRRERLQDFSAEEKEKFLPLCPDFAVELRSPSDRLGDLQDKMQEYVENGLRLGWLIDPQAPQRCSSTAPTPPSRRSRRPPRCAAIPCWTASCWISTRSGTPGFERALAGRDATARRLLPAARSLRFPPTARHR